MDVYQDSYDIDGITVLIDRLSKWQAVIFAVTCAERATPVCAQFGRERSLKLFKIVLDLVWEAANAREKNIEEVTKLRQTLDATPDAHIDDSDLPEHYAMIALTLLATVLETVTSDDGREPAKSVCYQMFNLIGDCDYMYDYPKNHAVAREIDTEHAQSLEIRESVAQQEVLKVLTSQKELSPDMLDHLRQQAQRLAKSLETVLPAIAKIENTLRQQKGQIPETYETLIVRIEGLAKWQTIAFSAACIERITPVFFRLATEQSRVLFESGLNLLWSACLEDKGCQEIATLRGTLEAIPEAQVGYAKSPLEVYPREILHLMTDALDAVESQTGTIPARFVCNGMFGWMYWFDFYWNTSTNTKKSPRRSFMADETAAQHEVLQVLDSHRGEPSSEVIHRLREQARQCAKTLNTRLPELFKIIEMGRY